VGGSSERVRIAAALLLAALPALPLRADDPPDPLPAPAAAPLLTLWPATGWAALEGEDRRADIPPAGALGLAHEGEDVPPAPPDPESIPRLRLPGLREGIDADGRIPKVPFPADLEHPERWRYLPEGLMPPGNMFQRFLRTTFITPILFFEDDVGTGGGVSIADADFRNSRRQEFANLWLSYTTEGQQQYLFTWRRWFHQRELESGGVVQEERSTITGSLGYTRTLTRRFYGFGADSDEDDETSYSESLVAATVDHQLTLPHPGDDWVLSWGARAERRNLGEGEADDVPDTADAFPETFADSDSYDSIWLEGGVRYDTRDSQHLPYRGGALGAGVTWIPLQSDDNHGAIFGAEGSRIWPLPPLFHEGPVGEEEHPPIDTAAVVFNIREAAGELPFWVLPSLGGNYTLRGYPPNRFTDDSSVHGTAEYRLWLVPRGLKITDGIRIERIGMALFADAGTVADSIPELFDEDLFWSTGVGIRMTFDRQALFRIDLGFSEEGSNLSINYGLSF